MVWRSVALSAYAAVVFIVGLAIVLATGASSGTWGYDYEAYAQAARRLLDGRPLYDPTVDLAGGFAVFLYPPPFAIAFVPFALLGSVAGLWAWTALLVACVVGAIALMPVASRIRWVVLLLAGLHWPSLYAIRLGQVGPILLLLFVLGWRWLDRPGSLGGVVGLGALIKVQPGLLVVWALLTGRVRAAVNASAVVIAACLVTFPVVGVAAWQDYVTLLGRVSQPIATPHNFTPGAVLFQAGIPADAATVVQWAVVALALAVVVLAVVRQDRIGPVPGYLVAVVASQLISPLLWDHYAVILLAPVAWLLQRGVRWAMLLPLATAVPFVGSIPDIVYPLSFIVVIVVVLWSGRAGRDSR